MGVVNLSCGLQYVYYEWVAMHGCFGFVMWVIYVYYEWVTMHGCCGFVMWVVLCVL